MEKKEVNEPNSNNKREIITAKIVFSTEVTPRKAATIQRIIDYYKYKCALEYYTPFNQIKSEDGRFVTIKIGVPKKQIDEVNKDFVKYADNLNIPSLSISFDSNFEDNNNLDSLEQAKKELEEIWKQYQLNSDSPSIIGVELDVVKEIIQEGDPKRIKFLLYLSKKYQPRNISFMTIVGLRHHEIFDYDKAEEIAKDYKNYYDLHHRETNYINKKLAAIDTESNYQTGPQPEPQPVEEKKPEILKETPAEEEIDYCKEFPLSENQDDEFVRVGLGDILNYIKSKYYNYLKNAIAFDMPYFIGNSTKNCSPQEFTLMLVDFLLNYKGSNAEGFLYYLCGHNSITSEKVLNSMICNIPIIEFAKLNNEDLVKLLIKYGCNANERTPESDNHEYVTAIAEMFGFGEENKIDFREALNIARSISGNQIGGQKK